MLHFGTSPRWREGVRIIQVSPSPCPLTLQVDICPEEMHNSVAATVPLQVNSSVITQPPLPPGPPPCHGGSSNEGPRGLEPPLTLPMVAPAQVSYPHSSPASDIFYRAACSKNTAATMELVKDGQEPLNYYAAFGKVSS